MNPLTPTTKISLSKPALQTLTKLSQRSTQETARLYSLNTFIAGRLAQIPSFFLPTTTRTLTLLQDTGALLALTEHLARIVLLRVEGCMHRITWNELSDEQCSTVHTLGDRLGLRCPDHVTNVIRLWVEVMSYQDCDGAVRDLGRIWRLEGDEGAVVLGVLRQKLEEERVGCEGDADEDCEV